ncbi:choice-of-anchor L domain-containing protein, partial [Flavobacteriaceae bacterium]|nr:choice-of-anchor L domain-containing protein [Flavobacteriaceae bacterium]
GNANGKSAFTAVSTNIQLDVSDQDGDALTYTIIDAPTNGTAIITETQGGGVLTYISNAGFEGTETLTYKANDGTADSNTAQVSINVFEKEPNLNWATYYSSSEMYSSKKDTEGNTYSAGSFYDFSNFIDNTTLNAVYPNGDRDGYIAKYDEGGELLWSNTFGGIYRDSADDIAIASDGNIIVSGSIRRVATFSDGEELGDINNSYENNYSIVLKLDKNSGEIIWKTYTGLQISSQAQEDDNKVLAKNDGTILSIINEGSNLQFLEINLLNGTFNLVNTTGFDNQWYNVYNIILDNLENVYITGYGRYNNEDVLRLVKYNSSYNEIWGLNIGGPGWDTGWNTAYDSINDQIYLTGRAYGVDMNPLGDEYIPSYADQQGEFFASYNSDGILQFMHLFASSSVNFARELSLNIMEDRLLVTGIMQGYPDLDITEDQFYPAQNYPFQTSGSKFVSIYGLENGLELTGLYFFNTTDDPYSNKTYLNGNNLIMTGDQNIYYQNMYNYDHEQLVSITNIPDRNDGNFGGKYSGVISYFTDPNNLNFAPVAIDQEVTTDEDTVVEITLTATDENGDVLSYSIVDQPLNGSVTLEGNIATYTPNELYDGLDSFTFIANDGLLDSNIATVSITVNNCLVNLSEADPLENCDINSNGFNVFDLTEANNQIFEGVDITEYEITYHETIEDAQNDENSIANPNEFTNTQAYNQEVYIRVDTDEPSVSANWHHYTMVLGTENNYSYDNIKFFVDGEEINVGCGQDWGSAWTYELSENPFVVGRAGDLYNYFSGSIDDIAIWNRALSSAEVEDLYVDSNQTSACESSNFLLQDGLVGYWPFCNNADDQTTNTNNGTLNGPVLAQDRFGVESSSYSFDGVDDYINMNAPILTGENAITYSFWAYTQSNEAMDIMGQFCLDPSDENCDNLKDIRLALNGSQTDGGCGFEGLSFKSPAHYATASFSSVSNNSTECFNTANINLLVNEAPLLNIDQTLDICDINNPGDNVEEFILEDSIDLLLTDQDGVIVTFYENEEDALNNLNALTSPYINTTNPQTIHVRAEIENLGCFSTTTLEISVFNSVGPTGDSDQSFCETVTIEELIVTGDNIQWYDSLEGGNILDSTTSLTDGQTVYASQTIDNCESLERLAITVNTNPTTIVEGETTQIFCSQEVLLSDLIVEGENIQWYDALEGGNLLDESTILSDGQTVYASQTIEGCESQELLAINIIINEIPDLVIANTTQSFENEAFITDISGVGTNVQYYDSESLDNIISPTTPLTNGQIVYVTQTIQGCESLALAITIEIDNTNENDPPFLIAEGLEFYCPLSEQNIVTSFNITDPDDTTIEALYIQISEGYVQGEDLLVLTGIHPGIQESWDPVTGKLELKGPGGAEALYTDLIAAVYDVKFISTNPNPTDKSFSFTIGDTNYLEETEHYYEFISLVDVTWTDAKALAENLTYYGLQGYLATITSEGENQIAAIQTNDVGWIGASDLATEGDWRWVTGPEGLENGGAGVPFWSGNGIDAGGSAVNGQYSNWNNPNEPNNAGPEHYAHVTSPNVGEVGSWNDLPNPASGGGDYQSKGFIVEYGGMPGDPILNLSSSTSLLAPTISIINDFNGCLNEYTGLEAESNTGNVYWYDNQIDGNLIFTGTSFNPDINETISYYVSPFAPGVCDDYDRLEVSATFIPGPIPVAPNVTVDQCTYTIEELVTEILINNECADVSNITYSTGTNFDDVNGIGYFSEPSNNFEFSQGIILSSGDADLGTGPNPGIGNESSGDFGWPGDSDLTTLLEQTDSANDNTNNASVIEFDFVPISNTISFRFIMASEEYDQGSFECSFSDIFGFFLTDQDGVTTNLAVLPDSDIPILVTNIHPDNGVCGAANPEYFGGYVAVGDSPIAYDGYTRAFTAQSEVVPGQTYHIKLAVADAGDSALDTAVYLEGGSFDLGIDLGDDILISNGNAPCPNDTYIIDTYTVDGEYTWYNNDIEIEGENSSILEVTETGNYSVNISYGDNCNYSDDLLIEYYIPLSIDSPETLISCDNNLVDGFGTYDLSVQTEVISTTITTIPTITYFETLEDAENDLNSIGNIESYDNITPFNQTIYVRIVEDTFPNCYSTTSFQLSTINPPIITIPTPLE